MVLESNGYGVREGTSPPSLPALVVIVHHVTEEESIVMESKVKEISFNRE
jgi:hypothetical protein